MLKKIIGLNVIVLLSAIGYYFWHLKELTKWTGIFSKTGGGPAEVQGLSLLLYQYEDVIIAVPNFIIYFLVVGLIVNIIMLIKLKYE
ncbi:hypothetical protein KKC17_03430 [Patescibacteria group bacterium]|nr:hypothetical protein [Patescibacteria group bacterium]